MSTVTVGQQALGWGPHYNNGGIVQISDRGGTHDIGFFRPAMHTASSTEVNVRFALTVSASDLAVLSITMNPRAGK